MATYKLKMPPRVAHAKPPGPKDWKLVITMACYALQMPPRVAHVKPPGPKEERLNDGDNNGQATHGARKPPGPIFCIKFWPISLYKSVTFSPSWWGDPNIIWEQKKSYTPSCLGPTRKILKSVKKNSIHAPIPVVAFASIVCIALHPGSWILVSHLS